MATTAIAAEVGVETCDCWELPASVVLVVVVVAFDTLNDISLSDIASY